MKKIIFMLLATLILASCGSKRDRETDEAVESQGSRLNEALEKGDYAHASMLADSLSLFVDELSPDETVTVLVAFGKICEKQNAEGETTKAAETMRKFVDVYDIGASINGEEMASALRHAPMDLQALLKAYHAKLADLDDASQDTPEYVEEGGEAPRQSSTKEEETPEKRPAEVIESPASASQQPAPAAAPAEPKEGDIFE